MATIVTRAGKGSALTFAEVDANFTNLNADGISNSSAITSLQNDKLDKSGGTVIGPLTVNSNLIAGGKVLGSSSNNSQSGATVTLSAPSTEIVRLTNVLLVSVSGISAGSPGQKLIIVNRTGTTVTVENESASATAPSDQIFTGDGAPILLENNASISLIYDSATAKWNVIGGVGSGTGSGGINYILNPDASVGTTGWSAYNDGAVAAPVDGSGGTPPAGLFVRSTVDPLRGSGDFNLVKTGSISYQGSGVSYDFEIDRADFAKVLTVSFDYEVLSGTYANGDLTVYLIQDPTGTPVVIQPAGFQVQAATVGTTMREIATFQTASGSVPNPTKYRLCFHIASTSTQDYTLAIDNVSVGPQVVQYGATVTDWQAYTPSASINQGLGTLANVDVYWRRVGSDIEVRGSFTTGTVAASEARLALPAGLSTTSDVTQNTIIGVFGRGVSTATKGGFMIKQNGVNYVCFSANAVFSGNATISTNPELGSAIFGSGDKVSIQFCTPILGWSSTVQMSNDTDTRVVSFNGDTTGGQVVTASVTDIQFSTNQDTHGAWDGSKFTAPMPGFYQVNCSMRFTTATSRALVLFVDGAARAHLNVSSLAYVAGSAAWYLNAGQTISVRSSVTSTVNTGLDYENTISIFRLSGPSAIAASETVAASYYLPADQSAGATTPINLSSKIFDTHGAVTIGSGWVFTAPIAGKYEVASYTYATTSSYNIILWKNGSAHMNYAGGTSGQPATASCTVELLAGDTLQLRPNTTVTIKGNSVLSTGDAAKVFIKRIGN